MTLKPLQHRLSALRRATGWLGLVALVILTGCAGYSPASLQPGQTAEQVRAVMGLPTGEHALPDGGRRLEYARGPAGLQTFMVDLDAQGRMTGWSQVLNDAAFARIQPGWSREQLQREFGRSRCSTGSANGCGATATTVGTATGCRSALTCAATPWWTSAAGRTRAARPTTTPGIDGALRSGGMIGLV